MKRANGSGTVVRYSGNRRRPWIVRITTGLVDGKPKVRVVGSYATRVEADAALSDYARSPYDIDARKITMAELYDRWMRRTTEQGRLATSTINGVRTAYKHCAALHDAPYITIKAHMMQNCINGAGGYGSQKQVRGLFYHLDNYAMELDIISKKYSDLITTAPETPKEKTIFTGEEVARLWNNVGEPWVDTVLILLYSGWRVTELLTLAKENIHIDDTGKTLSTMRGGIKTAAGKDRIVPIHSAILPLVQVRYGNAQKYLIERSVGKPTYRENYYPLWNQVMTRIGAKHTVHETRHTFRSWLDAANAPLSCINKIMGHKCNDIGLDKYTHKTIEELRSAIELIKTEDICNFAHVGNT